MIKDLIGIKHSTYSYIFMFWKVRRNYYCLVAGLQDIELDTHKLLFKQQDLKDYLWHELHGEDYALVEKLFLPYDNRNLLNILQKTEEAFDEKGNFSLELLEDQIKEPSVIPGYMTIFINAFKEKEPVYPEMSSENELTYLFYNEMLGDENDFIRWWYELQMNIRNILTGLNCRKYSLNLEHHIIGDNEVAETIRKSHAKDFGLANKLDYAEEIIGVGRTEDMQERELAVDKFLWSSLDDHIFFEYFTIERVLAFVLKTYMVERWLSLDKEHGREMFKKLIEELEKSYELPETFKK